MHLPRNATTPPRATWTALDLRERSCLLRCSLLLNARLQNWHLYFFSGADVVLRAADGDDSLGITAMTGIVGRESDRTERSLVARLGSRND